jgi:sugar/nucleoside kinase (ribokinase family)
MMLSIGDLVLDVTIVPARRLVPDDDTPSTITVGGGGQAANFCAWAAWLGEASRLITRVGDDGTGSRLVAELEAAGVAVCAIRGPESTGVIAVLIGPDSDRTMATMRGASIGLKAEDLKGEWFAGAALLHVPGYSLFREPIHGATQRAIREARAHGAQLAIDLSSVAGLLEFGPPRMAAELRRLQPEILLATMPEAETLGVPLEDLAAHAAVKLGAAGALVGARRIVAPEVETVDPTGAGDAFAAAFCAAMLHGAGEVEAAERAVEVAAEAVRHAGARPVGKRVS